MGAFKFTIGDTEPPITGAATGTIGDLTGGSVAIHVEAQPATVVVAGTIVSGPAGTYQITFDGTEFASTTPGTYQAKLVWKTAGDAETLTTPPFDFVLYAKALS